MKKYKDPIGYLKEKVGKASHEIERKKLNVDPLDIERRLEEANCVEVFSGAVISDYYSVDTEGEDGLKFLRGFFGLEQSLEINVGSGGGFSRLRHMTSDDGAVDIYLAETRLYQVNIHGVLTPHVDKGVIFDYSQYNYVRGVHDSHQSIKFKQREIKHRLCCIIPDVEGLEYCLDKITNPVEVSPYLEVEVSSSGELSFEKFIHSVQRLDLKPEDFQNISARRLIDSLSA